MTKHFRVNCFVLLVCLLLSACAAHFEPGGESDGIGGTGVIADKDSDGIGGTGVVDPGTGDRDGVGGTGLWSDSGDVAMFGIITAVDPLVINGHGMLMNESTQITLNEVAASTAQVKQGSVAWVKAGIRDGAIFAEKIALENIVSGVVESHNANKGEFVVAGQRIRWGQRAEIDTSGIAPGRWISVAGIRDLAGVIQASLVEFNPAQRVEFVLSSATSSLPFQGEVSAYSIQTYAAVEGNRLILNPHIGYPASFLVAKESVEDMKGIVRQQAAVVEFRQAADRTLKLQGIRPSNGRNPSQTVIPRYVPPTPNGTLVPGSGISPMPSPRREVGTEINTDINVRPAVPNRAPPTGGPSRPPTVPPDVLPTPPRTDVRPVPIEPLPPSIDAGSSIGAPR
ncbi:MAG: DUF5666 domain-containing protein [Pseudomonadota bacterium]